MELNILEKNQLAMGFGGPFDLSWLLADIQSYGLAPLDKQQALALTTIHTLLKLELMQAGGLGGDGEFFLWKLSPDEAVERIKQEWDALGRDPILYEIVWFRNTAEGDRIGAAAQIGAGGPMLAEAMELSRFEQQLVLESCNEIVGLQRVVVLACELGVGWSNEDIRGAVIASLDRLNGARLIGFVWRDRQGRSIYLNGGPSDISYLNEQWDLAGDETNPGDILWFRCLEDGEELARRLRTKEDEEQWDYGNW